MVLKHAAVPQSETSPYKIDISEIQSTLKITTESADTPLLIIITKGEGTLTINGTTYRVVPGFLLMLNQGEYELAFSKSTRYIRISAEESFFKEFLAQNLSSASSQTDPVDIWTVLLTPAVHAQFISVTETVFKDPLFTPCNTRLGLHQLFITLLSSTKSESLLGFLVTAAGAAATSPGTILLEHFGEELSGERMAKLTNMSFSSLNRYFKENYGAAPSGWIKKKRLEKARNQLLLSKNPVTEIALACGFKETAHFSRAFKSEYGISPLEYRKRSKLKHTDKKLNTTDN
ncbi:MAG: helix-turn-helix transcriptional regulator [Spirochaetales bacterium]|nr:helix-turn-helix transcriptional regulator [Spirochaetales bacterium]